MSDHDQQPGPPSPDPQPPRSDPPQQAPYAGSPATPSYRPPSYDRQASAAPLPLRPDEEKTWSALAHFGALLLGFIAPLLVYVIYRDRSRWVAETSKEALNFNISYAIYLMVAAFSIVLLVGIVLFPVVIVAYYAFIIVGGIKTLNGQFYRFPLIFRLVS